MGFRHARRFFQGTVTYFFLLLYKASELESWNIEQRVKIASMNLNASSDLNLVTGRDFGMNIYDLYHRMESNKVVLSFKGDVTSELMASILQIIEQRMDDRNEAPRLRKKVYNVLVECLQNLYHHIDEIPSSQAKKGTDRSAIFMISLNPDGYSITTGNYILSDRQDSFKESLERINSLSKEELKDLYKEVLNSDGRSNKGGGGLGMIDIARKTGKKLNYEFAPLNEEYSFFSLNINVDEN